jgi:hypothetical protein
MDAPPLSLKGKDRGVEDPSSPQPTATSRGETRTSVMVLLSCLTRWSRETKTFLD